MTDWTPPGPDLIQRLADRLGHDASHPSEAQAPGILTDAEADMITDLACRLFTRAQRARAAAQLARTD